MFHLTTVDELLVVGLHEVAYVLARIVGNRKYNRLRF